MSLRQHVITETMASASTADPSPSLADLPTDVLADVGARLTVGDVGNLLLVSRGVRDSVRTNEPLWATQYRMRWVRAPLPLQSRVEYAVECRD